MDWLEWARRSAVPLRTVSPGSPADDLLPLDQMIGDATVVALSEAVHGAAELLDFRNRVFEFLVRQKGFTAIAIESGIVEGRALHDYVRDGSGDLDTAVACGIGWGMDKLPQNRALVAWMREWNADPHRARKINFYGFDVPGSPASLLANRGHETALEEALRFLDCVDSVAGATFRERLEPLTVRIGFTLSKRNDTHGYKGLACIERDALTAAVSDLISLLERKEAQYTATSSDDDYQWGYRAGIGARQMDHWLRQIPLEDQSEDSLEFFATAMEVRDRAQADNLDWAIKREGPAGKTLIFASRYHLSTAPVKASCWLPGKESEQQVAGTYLRRRLGDKLLTIGNAIGRCEAGCGESLEPALSDSIDGIAGEVGLPCYLLDLRIAPDPARDWFRQERNLAHPSSFKMAFGKAFDVLFYVDAVHASV